MKKVLFGLILILAFVLRIWQLGDFPAGFTADEAAQGYTAYSILKTGRDEWGIRLPLTPRSFGDFKPPLYTYLTIPSIAIFGLNEFAVRLPGAILGTLSVLATMLLVRELFKNSLLTIHYSLLTGFLLAISPWHLSLSRGAFEAALTVFFLPAGFWLFLKGVKQPRYLSLASIFFGLNLFSYHAAKLFTPLFLIILIFWQRRGLRKFERSALLAGAIFALLATLAFCSTLAGGRTRAADIGIFSVGYQAPKLFLDSYFSYLSPEFFFTRGAGEATYGMIPGIGALYLFELPLLIIALVSLSRKWNRIFLPIIAWFLLAPIPASLSRGVGYHANRVAVMMPALQILSAYGLVCILGWRLKYKRTILLLLAIWIFVSASFFLWAYFRSSPKISAPSMSYGWREAMDYITQVEDDYQKIVISRQFSEPQAFIAFYKKWDPADFQKESQDWLKYEREGLKFVDQLGKYGLGKYEFRDINWSEDKNLRTVLFAGKEKDFPKDLPLAKRIIPYPNGQPAFLIIERP